MPAVRTPAPQNVKRQQLHRARLNRLAADDAQRAGVAPDVCHEASPGHGSEGPIHRRRHLVCGERADRRADEEAHHWRSVVLAFDELVVDRRPAERPRQHLLDERDQVCAKERHPRAGQLLVAAHVVRVEVQPETVEQTATAALLDHGVISEVHVHHQLRAGREERREHEGIHAHRAHNDLALDDRDLVGHDVDIVDVRGRAAGQADVADLGRRVETGRAAACGLDEACPGRGAGLGAEPEAGARNVEARPGRRQADPGARARVGVHQGGRAQPLHVRHPACDSDGLGRWHMRRRGQRGAERAAERAARDGERVELDVLQTLNRSALREPLLDPPPELGVPQPVLDAHHARGKFAPHAGRCPRQAELGEEQPGFGSLVSEEIQVDRDAKAGPPGPAGPRLVMRVIERVVEVGRLGQELEPGPADRPARLELIQREVDASFDEFAEGALDTERFDEPLDIGKRHARVVEQALVGADGPGEHPVTEEVEKGLAPVAQLAAHDPDAVVRRQRRGEERPQPGRVAPQHSRRFEHGMRPTSRRYPRCGASGASAVLTSV